MQSLRPQLGLNGLNFFSAAMQVAFGPFFTVYLTTQEWTQGRIGFALSVGTVSALVFQLPAGFVVDTIHFKLLSAALALLILANSALMVVAAPTDGMVLASQILHGFASCMITPAIASLTLILCGHAAYSERLGVNGRYASLGAAFAAALLGGFAHFLSERAVFLVGAAFVVPALASLLAIRATDRVPEKDEHPAVLHPRDRRRRQHRAWHIFRETPLHTFAGCVVLFHLANAAMLPLALNELAKRIGHAGFVVSAAIIVPQVVVALFAPFAGRLAEQFGRRPILLVGFAALPLRALLFVTLPDAVPLVLIEVLDGVSATV